MVESLGKKNDILLSLSTSGSSKNIIKAIKQAKKQKIKTFSFLGGDGGDAKSISDLSFVVPSNVTGRVQESHITAGHALMELIENELLGI